MIPIDRLKLIISHIACRCLRALFARSKKIRQIQEKLLSSMSLAIYVGLYVSGGGGVGAIFQL